MEVAMVQAVTVYRIGNSEFDEYDRPNFRLWRDMEFRMKR